VKLNPKNLRALYGLFFACSWLAQKSAGQKRKDLAGVAAKAAEKIIEKYQSEGQGNAKLDEHVRAVEEMLASVQLL